MRHFIILKIFHFQHFTPPPLWQRCIPCGACNTILRFRRPGSLLFHNDALSKGIRMSIQCISPIFKQIKKSLICSKIRNNTHSVGEIKSLHRLNYFSIFMCIVMKVKYYNSGLVANFTMVIVHILLFLPYYF